MWNLLAGGCFALTTTVLSKGFIHKGRRSFVVGGAVQSRYDPKPGTDQFTLVRECYMHGRMKGELLDKKHFDRLI